MGGVDQASHLRVNFSCYKPYEKRWWRPILYWLLDICINNAYLLWKLQKNNQSRRLHETFFDDLVRVMLNYDPWTPAPGQDSCLHEPVKLQSRQRCAWGWKSKGGCVQGDKREDNKRRALRAISGNARPDSRPRQVQTGCKQCRVALCIDRACWRQFHESGMHR